MQSNELNLSRYNDDVPRAHEAGGKYGNGVIGRRYVMGQTIDIEVDIRNILVITYHVPNLVANCFGHLV